MQENPSKVVEALREYNLMRIGLNIIIGEYSKRIDKLEKEKVLDQHESGQLLILRQTVKQLKTLLV